MITELSCIGKPTERPDAFDKVEGRTRYVGDLYLPGMLHGASLRSKHSHARIVKLDTSVALALPGVKAVLTAADVPRRRLGERLKDQPLLAEGIVRFAGERLAVVAAEDEATARRAIELIQVEYEQMPAILEIEGALRLGASQVHKDMDEYLKTGDHIGGNVYAYERITRGNLEDGWAKSDHIFEDTFTTQSVHQGYLENHAALAAVEPDGRATIWSSNKAPFVLREQLAAYIGIPEECLRIVAPSIGGEFGGKGAVMDEPLCYYLSLTTGRPVRMVMQRSEELAASNPRHPSVISIKSGMKNNGELIARQVSVRFDSGAYGGAKPNLLLQGFNKTAGPYRIPNLLIEGYSIYTNNDPCGQCRAPGHPQAVFAVESHMDMLAKRLDMDPLAFRLLNVLNEGEEAPTGEKWHHLRAREVLETAAQQGGWYDFRQEGTGLGLALGYRNTGGGQSGAVVTISADGQIEVLTGITDPGTGAWTILSQIAAEELGVSPLAVRIVPGDTSIAPSDRGSSASRVTHVAGWAVKNASVEAASILKKAASQILGCASSEVEMRAGRFWSTSPGRGNITYAEVASVACAQGPIICPGFYDGQSKDTVAFAAHLAKVRIDRETGGIIVERLVAVHDIGRVINPPAAEGQVEGSVMQGIGFALWEDLAKQEGKLFSTALADYHQPTSLDLPDVEVVFLEGACGPAPFEGKGIGEVSIIPVAAAIANALEDAAGIRLVELPLTPEKVWLALQKNGG